MKAERRTGVQYAALPYRFDGRRLEILLITSRRSQRWIIPKGWPINGLRPAETAATEAAEEAGVVGEVDDRAVGAYAYVKRLKNAEAMPIHVTVYPLQVLAQSPAYKELGQRRLRWFDWHEAASRVAEPGLRTLIRDFGHARAPNLLVRALRRYRDWRIAARA